MARITDRQLEAFLADASGERRTVLIEVTAPKVAPSTPRAGYPIKPTPGAPRAPARTGTDAARLSMDAVQAFLDALRLPEAPVRLSSARTFVADLTAEELRRVLELDAVAAVRPNREHSTHRAV